MRFNPASLSAPAISARREPFVVSVRSFKPSTPESISTSRGRPRRTVGSPPVRRIFSTPCATKIRASRVISSKLRISSRARNW